MKPETEPFLNALRTLLEPVLDRILEDKVQKALATSKSGEPINPYLTIKEAADISRLGPSTVRLLIRKRQLKALQVGRRVIIKRTDLEKYLEAHPIEALPD